MGCGYVAGSGGAGSEARIGAPDPALTARGLIAVSELCDRLGVIEAVDCSNRP